MPNDLTLIATDNQLPDYLRQPGMGYEDTGVGSGIAPRAPRLGITTAKQFTITKDGNKMILPQNTIRGVIVAGAENITKAWYAKSYVQGTTEAPDCFSNDSKTPAPGVKMPQCSSCAACPKNAFGSHPVTGRGKACGDRKMIVFVWEGMPNELMTFNVPTMSLPMLRKIDTELKDKNIPLQAVMVELSFDPAIVYPVVKISAVGFVAQATALELIAKSKTAEISDLLRETDFEVSDSQNSHEAAPLVQATQTGELVGQTPATTVQVQQNAAEPAQAAEPGRRRRRTKAEMEAARAAEAAAASGNPLHDLPVRTAGEAVTDLINQTQTEVVESEEARKIRELQEQLAALQKPKEPEETPEQRRIRELQEQLARAQQTAAQPTVQVTKEPSSQPEMPAGVAGADVMDLLNKWKNA